ncbi:MAG: glycosyltransferase family 9 protein [Nibricoccus sp.]
MLTSLRSWLRILAESAAVAILPLFVRRTSRRQARVLIFKPDRLGDLIVVAPHIQAMIGLFGPEEIVLVVTDANQAAARLLFPLCELIVVPLYLPLTRWKTWLSVMRSIASIEAEHALFIRHYMRFPHTKAMWRVARARNKIWVKKAAGHVLSPASDTWLMNGRGLIIDTPPAPRESVETHVAKAMLVEVCGAGARPAPLARPAFRQTDTANGFPTQAIVFPFSNSPLRDLPAGMSASIVTHLVQKHGLRVALCGTPDRRSDLDRIATLAKESLELDQRDRATVFIPSRFETFYQAILDARIVISTDTGSAHVAIVHDRPMVGLLGGGQFGIFAPWSVSDRQTWVSHSLPCYGCNWNCKFERAHCVTDIPLPAIHDAIDGVLAQP